MMNVSVADDTEAMTATLSDETKFSQIREKDAPSLWEISYLKEPIAFIVIASSNKCCMNS